MTPRTRSMSAPRLHHGLRAAAVLATLALASAACTGEGKGGKDGAPGMINALSGGKPQKVEGIVAVGEVPPEIASITGKIWQLATRARRLKPKGEVKLAVLSPQQIVDVVRKKVAVEIPKDLIRGEGRVYAALGRSPPDYDYEAETYSLLEEQLAGLYIPEDRTMYLSRAIEEDELEATLAHELVHALQDQHFGIGERMKFRPGETDAIAAIHALAEGDATAAMIDQMVLAKQGDSALLARDKQPFDRDPEDLLQSQLEGKKHDSKIGKTPRFLAVGLLAPYADGMRFVQGMRQRGGWRAVDAAWARPPATTEQLLHLDKYDANEPAIDVPAVTANALGEGFTKTYDDVFGEQEGRIAIAEWMDVKSAKRAASGWGGDRVVLYERGDDRAVAWRVVFDDENEAAEAFGLIDLGWGKTWGVPSFSKPGAGKGDELHAWGPVPLVAAVSPTADTPANPPATGKTDAPTVSALPPLPDAPGVAPPKMTSCRALKHSGRAVTMLAGVPCASVVAWAAEAGKAP